MVEDLPGDDGVVAVPAEVERQGDGALERRGVLVALRDVVDAIVKRIRAGEEAGARRLADRRLAAGVVEERAAAGEGVEVRGGGLRVAAQAADPVVQVIDGEKQDVGTFGGGGAGGDGGQQAGAERGEAEQAHG